MKHPSISAITASLICLAPAMAIVFIALLDGLGPDPGQQLLELLGWYALLMLMWTFVLPDACRIPHISRLRRYRRWFGVASFNYASAHIIAMYMFVLGMDLSLFISELTDRPYMVMGLVGWFLLLPLALTSNQLSVRHLKKHWAKLHLLMYPAMFSVLIHYAWQVRQDYVWVITFGIVFLVLALSRKQRIWAKFKAV